MYWLPMRPPEMMKRLLEAVGTVAARRWACAMSCVFVFFKLGRKEGRKGGRESGMGKGGEMWMDR